MQELVRAVREVRNRYSVDPKTPLDVSVRCRAAVAADFRALAPFITQLAGVGTLDVRPGRRQAAPGRQRTCTPTSRRTCRWPG